MLEIKHFKQAQLKSLLSVKNNKYDPSSFEKKCTLVQTYPMITFLFLACTKNKAKNQEAAHLLWKYLWQVIAV